MKLSKEKIVKGTVSVEQLHHFTCNACNKWWSVGDAHLYKTVTKRVWFCPWCGIKQKVKK